jgi:DNA-binding response OmpR family regulator
MRPALTGWPDLSDSGAGEEIAEMTRTVLVIEDEAHIAEALRFLLSRAGWRVAVHADGTTAMDLIRDIAPSALILDVMLPGRSGYEILEDLRADPVLRDLPVLILTARGQERERALAEMKGASLFMTKPFANDELIANLRQLAGDPAAAESAG